MVEGQTGHEMEKLLLKADRQVCALHPLGDKYLGRRVLVKHVGCRDEAEDAPACPPPLLMAATLRRWSALQVCAGVGWAPIALGVSGVFQGSSNGG